MQVSGQGAEVAHDGNWTSRFGFLMASIGFAVGLGNIWRFPYMTGENGGAAFVLVYLVCAFGIAVPILMAELMIGRRGRRSPPGCMRELARAEGGNRHWQWAGAMNLLVAFLIEIVYCVISGWVLLYLYKAVTTGFHGMDGDASAAAFTAVTDSTLTMLPWTWLGLLLTGLIIYAGVQKGIERTVSWMMPTLFLLLVGLAVFNMFGEGFDEALAYLFSADFSRVTPAVWLAAVGQAFFSIGVGMAGMMVYGSYLPKSVSIGQSAVIVAVADTGVAMLAGLVIFPAVFRFGLDPAAGPGLIFQTLPVAFAQMPGGWLFSVLFFLLLSFAAITSMVGLVESLTAWLEEHHGFRRHRSAVAVLVVIGLLSVLSMLSFNTLHTWTIAGRDLVAGLDYISNQIMLPLGGLLIALFAGWQMRERTTRDELAPRNEALYMLWRFLIRFPVPVAVAVILLSGVGG